MMRKILLGLLGIVCWIAGFPQTPKAVIPDDNSLLWRVSGKGIQPSYLFGTIHIICSEDYFWTDKMKQGLEKSKAVCFEMDMDDPALMTEMAGALMDMSGKTLKDYFSEDVYKKIAQYVKDTLGLDISMFQQMKPIALLTLISTHTSTCVNTVSYEEKIMEQAKKDHKEVMGMEELKEQLALLDKLPIDSIIKDLSETISNTASTEKDEYADMVTAYKQQKLPELFKILQSSKEMGDLMGDFLDERNKKWVQRMPQMMAKQSVFFAVGAGHLWGDVGVISLLRKAGYKVEAVK